MEQSNLNQPNETPVKTQISDVLKDQFDATPLSTLLGTKITIKSFEKKESESKGSLWTITLEDGTKYYTFSKVVGDQLEILRPALEKGVVEGTVNKVKNYYTLS